MYAQKALNDPAYEDSYKKAFEYNSHQYLPQPKANDILRINCPQKYGKIFNPQGNDAEIMGIINDIEKGDFHEAAYKLPSLSAALPNYYLTHYLTGVVMAGLEQDNEAIKAFESLASLGQIYYSEAEKSFSKADAAKSIEYFNKAIKLNPNLSTYNYYIGLNNLLIGNNDDAIKYFDKAISQRANDYNSMYYKAIAQEIKGDYPAVIDSTTKLLNRHVSNYNSVMYLKALANAKAGNSDAALEDIEKIFTGLDDIYNADIKTTSAKEATLPGYLHLLKAQILTQKGENASEDYEKAFENPVIKSLSSNSGFDFSMSADDLENQIDYMRTAFDSFGKIIPNASGYRVTSGLIPVLSSSQVEKSLSDNEGTVDLTPSVAQKMAQTDYEKAHQIQPSKPETKPVVKEEAPQAKPEEVKKSDEAIKIGSNIPGIIPSSKGESMIFTASDVQKTVPADSVAETPQPVKVVAKEIKTTESVAQTPEIKPEVSITEPVVAAKPAQPAIVLRQAQSPEELLLQSGEQSMAHDLATQAMINQPQASDEGVKIAGNVKTDIKNTAEAAVPVERAVDSTIVSAPIQKATEDFNIKYEEPAVDTVVSKAEDIVVQQKEMVSKAADDVVNEPVKVAAKVVKETPEFKISYDDKKAESAAEVVDSAKQDVLERINNDVKDLELAKEKPSESLAKTIARAEAETEPNTVESVEQVAQTPKVILPDLGETIEKVSSAPAKVTEKYADVDVNDYNVQKKTLVINPGDEIIEFDPSSPMFNKRAVVAVAQPAVLGGTPRITDNFSQIHKVVKETVETVDSEVEGVKETAKETAEAAAKAAEDTAKAAEAAAKVAEAEHYEAPELVLPETIVVEKVATKTETDVPTVAPKVRQKAQEVEEAATDVVSAQTEEVPADSEWLKDILDKAQDTPEAAEKKAKRVKAQKEETVQDFLTDNDEKLAKKAKKLEEKRAKLKAKKEAKLAKEALRQEQAAALAEEKARLQAEQDAINAARLEEKAAKEAALAEEKAIQEAAETEEKARIAAEKELQKAAKAEKEAEIKAQKAALKAAKADEKARLKIQKKLQKAAKAEEKARLKAEKEVQKAIDAGSETAAAVTVIEGDRLIKVRNKKEKEHKKFTWWWQKQKSEASAAESKGQTTKRKWFRKDK